MKTLNKSFISGSLILLISFNIFNAFNFIFQFSMARMLSVSDYGALAALFSIIYIMGIFTESIQTVITKYTSEENSPGKIKNLVKRSLRKSIRISLILFLVYLIIAIPLSLIINVDYYLVAINGIVLVAALILPITRGAMLGMKRFVSLGKNLTIESSVKLFLALLLVWLGLRTFGAMIAIVFSSLLAFVFSFVPLKNVMKSKEKQAKAHDIYGYTKPVFIVTLAIVAAYSIDVLIAKIVFDSVTAGYYAIASILAKILFWGTSPIIKAMFPISVSDKSKKQNKLFYHAMIASIALLIIGLLIIYFFPEKLVLLFTGKSLIEPAKILFTISLGMAIISLSNLVLFYKLSKGRTSGYYLTLVLIGVEAALLFTFSSNLVQFSQAFLSSSVIFLIGSFLLSKR